MGVTSTLLTSKLTSLKSLTIKVREKITTKKEKENCSDWELAHFQAGFEDSKFSPGYFIIYTIYVYTHTHTFFRTT